MKIDKSTSACSVAHCQIAPTSSIRDSVAIRRRVLSTLEASRKDVSPLDLLEILGAEGIQEESIRAVVSAMLAESMIEMTSTRKLRSGIAKKGLNARRAAEQTDIAGVPQGMAAGAGVRG